MRAETTPIEREWKYRLGNKQQAQAILRDQQLLDFAAGSWQETVLASVYYDTEDTLLRQSGIALRRRYDGVRHILCCKHGGESSEGLYQRFEEEIVLISVPYPRDLPLYEFRIGRLLHDLTKTSPLIEIAATEFVRKALIIEVDKSRIEVAIDEGTLRRKFKKAPLLEVELELKEGDAAVLDRMAQDLALRHGLIIEEKSKLQRALELVQD